VCREAVPQIGGEDWEGPLADGSKVDRWHDQLLSLQCLSDLATEYTQTLEIATYYSCCQRSSA